MKKFIYISGIASAIFMFLGAMFKVQHWPGANLFLIVSVLIFCVVFLPFALLSSYRSDTGKKYGFLYIVSYVVFFIVFVSALFKILHWPGAGTLLIIGIPLPFVLFLPVYFIQTRKDKNYSIVNFIGIIFGMIFLAVFSALLSLNVSSTILNNFQTQFFYNQNLVQNVFTDKQSPTKQNTLDVSARELCSFIENIKDELLNASENKPEEILNSEINMMSNSHIPLIVLHNNDKNSNLQQLENKITLFKQEVISSEKATPKLKELTNSLINFEINENKKDKNINWENKEFINYNLIIVLDALTRLESNVMFIEQEISTAN